MSEPVTGPCEECGTVTTVRHVWRGGEEWWLCRDCRADRETATRLGAP